MKQSLRLLVASLILAGTIAAAAAPVNTTQPLSGINAPLPTCGINPDDCTGSPNLK